MKSLFIFTSALFLAGCGSESPVAENATEEQEQYVYLVKTDSIGVELGDSTLVFGALEGVVTGPDGNIAVLDRAACCIRVFSPEGEFLRQISRKGNGPGELMSNAFLTITEEGTLLVTGDGGEVLGIHAFNYSTGEWLGSEPSFGSPPTCLEGASGNTYMRKNLDFDGSSGEPMIVITITLNELGTEEPLVTFMEETVPFDPSDMASMVSLVWFGYDLACDFNGHYYVAPRSSEEAVIHAYDSAGSELYALELDLEPVQRTVEELETEKLILTAKAAAMGGDIPPLEPDPWKPMIRGLEVDDQGNLWVLLGGMVQPRFKVFSPEGVFLYSASVAGEQRDGDSWTFSFKGGLITAWAEEPSEGFQKVWLLSSGECTE